VGRGADPGWRKRCDITEICLRNGTLEDCAGCPYTTCLHFGEQGGCFYGGVMVQEVYPAIREADAAGLLCPNYNDALSANLTAAINRLTALYRTTSFADKAVFAIVVSGYSGGDIVACQAAGAMNMNKGLLAAANSARWRPTTTERTDGRGRPDRRYRYGPGRTGTVRVGTVVGS